MHGTRIRLLFVVYEANTEEGQEVKPYLFIDVDGVLNPDSKLASHTRYEILDYIVYLNPNDGKNLLALTDLYELVWATTWQKLANEHIGPKIGLPELAFVPFTVPQPVTRNKPSWVMLKTFEVVKYAHGNPFAWLDDDFQKEDLKELDNYNCLPIKIWPFSGLLPHHFSLLQTWGRKYFVKTSQTHQA